MSVNAREERFESIELLGKPALFTNSRINRATVPEGFYCYDLRGSDYDPGKPVTAEKSVAVNHAATVLTAGRRWQQDNAFIARNQNKKRQTIYSDGQQIGVNIAGPTREAN